MKRFASIAIITLFIISGLMVALPGVGTTTQATPNETKDHPYGWTHRPVLEHFTGLSCPPCMHGAHPDATRLWEEEGYLEGGPWNYVEFHELNGGQEDDLMTDDSRDRMRFYQPGGAGTPDLESDGGYVQLGGSHGSTAEATYDDMKEALQDSGERDAIKKVNVQVGMIYDGSIFSIKVNVDYIQNDEPFFPTPEEPIPDDTLNGILYIFMVEDNVTAYSQTLDNDGEENPYVTVHNVFREYALEDKTFQMQPGDSDEFYAEWEVPDTMIIDDEEVPIKIPVNPNNVMPVAVVFNDDDRSSGRGDGSENSDGDGGGGSPRALNSATPAQTAFDLDNKPPLIQVNDASSEDGNLKINAQIWDDGNELTAAFVIYRELGKNDTMWKYKPLTIDGVECTDDVCTIGSGEAFAVLPVSDSTSVEFSIAAYDGNWTKGSSPMTIASIDSEDETGISILVVGSVVVILALVGAFLYSKNANQGIEGIDEVDEFDDIEESEEYEDWEDTGDTGDAEEKPYSWNEFRSLNKGKSSEEISQLWKDYKEDN